MNVVVAVTKAYYSSLSLHAYWIFTQVAEVSEIKRVSAANE